MCAHIYIHNLQICYVSTQGIRLNIFSEISANVNRQLTSKFPISI